MSYRWTVLTLALCFAQSPTRAQELPLEELLAEEDLESVREAFDEELPEDAYAPELEEDVVDLPEEEVEVDTREAAALPTGEAKSGVTPQSISLPTGEGSMEGMGESFEAALQSGAASFGFPLSLPPGRAGVVPSLQVGYSSTSGNGPLGIGWNLGAGGIQRQTDRGLPRYRDAAAWHPEEDRFIYGAGQELVPVDSAAAMLVDCGAPDCAPIPAELQSWQQYRSQNEGGFHRIFRSPDGTRWVVQSPDGGRSDFGLLPAGEGPADLGSGDALVRDGSGRVFAWKLTRTSDANGSTIYYRYLQDGGRAYLADVFYVSPHAACGALPDADARMRCDAPLADYAVRVHLVYEERQDATTSFGTGWRIETALRLKRVEMTAAADAVGSRFLVRRYHFRYAEGPHHSLLESVQLEGRPDTFDPSLGVYVGDATVSEASLGDALIGRTTPPMRFSYTELPAGGAVGFGGLEATLRDVAGSPPHSVDEARSDLFDINADGLPDLLVTDPARYRTDDGAPAVGVFFNGFSGDETRPADTAASFGGAVTMPIPEGWGTTLSLSNQNVRPMDADGDGRGDLLHLPRGDDAGYFLAARNGDADAVRPSEQGWRWLYVPGNVAERDPRIDFTRDGGRYRLFDVDNDHLVDVVRTAGDRIQIWRNLGWTPGGDGRFGSASHDGAQWVLSDEPVEVCLPVGALPVDFADPEVRLADMNGDGQQDLVAMRRGHVRYWPGRGIEGFGDFESCAPGLQSGGYVDMVDAPPELHADAAGVHLLDVDGDGQTDVLQLDTRDVHVWFNRSGASFTERVTVRTDAFAAAFAPRTRIADIDGSGTVDIVFGRAGEWQYLDLLGGQRPRLLRTVTSPMGGRTTITYGTSTEDYLRDLRDADAGEGEFTWSTLPEQCDEKLLTLTGECAYRPGGSPVVIRVVREVSSDDRLDVVGGEATRVLTQHAYHDAYYEGFEQELRGFGAGDAIVVGDAADGHPSSYSRSTFLQGRRPSRIASERLEDNPNDPLTGRVVFSERFDEDGRYLGTTHTSYAVRELHVGLDGRTVRYAYAVQSDELVYDVVAWAPGAETVTLPSVRHESSDGTPIEVRADDVVSVRGAGWAHTRSTTDEVTNLGQALRTTAHGRLRGAFGETPADESIVSHAEVANVGSWVWRNTASWTTGHGDPTPLGQTATSFDARGNVVGSSASVTQPQLYDFSGDGSALGFSGAPQQPVASTEVDVWGQAVQTCDGGDVATGAGCLTYAELERDAEYAQTVVAESAATGRDGASWTLLTSTAIWDRGLGTATSVTDPNGIVDSVVLDGVARMTAQIPPPATGCPTGRPSVRIRYEEPDPETRPLGRVFTTTELSCTGALGTSTLESIAYLDSSGQARATLTLGDAPGEWVRSGIVTRTSRGSVRRSYQPTIYGGSTEDLAAVLARPSEPLYTWVGYDAFDRPVVQVAEDGSQTWTHYHALSTDVCDPLDNDATHAAVGTCTTSRVDGHGREIDRILRNRQPGVSNVEYYRMWMDYRADGAVVGLHRAQTSNDAPRHASVVVDGHQVSRAFVYDSLGRRIASTDPDTDDPMGAAADRSWRYLFNRGGDLVAVRDPRGCGQNFFYDHGGRLIGEQYVSCGEAQAQDLPVDDLPAGVIALDETTGVVPVDARHYFDSYAGTWAPSPSSLDDYPATTTGVLGRLTATVDRAVRTVVAYDARGQTVWSARQLAVIGDAAPIASTLADPARGAPPVVAADATSGSVVFDETNTYVVSTSYDHSGRGTALVLPRDPATGMRVAGTMSFNRRSLPAAADAWVVDGGGAPSFVDGVLSVPGASVAVQPIVSAIAYLRDGLVSSTTYGDGTQTQATYDVRRRPTRTWTTRTPTAPSDPTAPLGAVTVVADQGLQWDSASNLVAVTDDRIAAEWPAGHRPQSTTIGHDALYRVTGVEMDYGGADVGGDWRAEMAATYGNDPMRTRPAPMLGAAPTGRVMSLAYEVDWLGNVQEWTDDAHHFYERSLGEVTNGAEVGGRPSAMYLAADLEGPPGSRAGWVELDYGDGGNVVAMTVHSSCSDAGSVCEDPGGALSSRRDGLRASCTCAEEQHYQYRWDELNRLSEARRYDRTGGSGSWQLEVRQRYRYDEANQRRVKQTLDAVGERIALSVLPGDMERRGVVRGVASYDDDPVLGSETQYLVAGARMVWRSGTPTPGVDRNHRITIPIQDLLHTTSAVIDVVSGELLEHGTYYPNGARETYRSSGDVAPEPMGFTGKEGDEEVGLTYFGERYLIPRLGRWASPDPLAIHEAGGGETLNSYHYVAGNLLQARDPIGLSHTPTLEQSMDQIQTAADNAGKDYTGTPASGTAQHKVFNRDLTNLNNERIITEAIVDPNGTIVSHGVGPHEVSRLRRDPSIINKLKEIGATHWITLQNGREVLRKGYFRSYDVLLLTADRVSGIASRIRSGAMSARGHVITIDFKNGSSRLRGQAETLRRMGTRAVSVMAGKVLKSHRSLRHIFNKGRRFHRKMLKRLRLPGPLRLVSAAMTVEHVIDSTQKFRNNEMDGWTYTKELASEVPILGEAMMLHDIVEFITSLYPEDNPTSSERELTDILERDSMCAGADGCGAGVEFSD